jgi:protocatechuate 3,4-dioxygenase beta subunit
VTGADGAATFVTVFPGWYSGRTVHIHFKVRKGDYEFTSQLFFDESTIASVMAKSASTASPTSASRASPPAPTASPSGSRATSAPAPRA